MRHVYRIRGRHGEHLCFESSWSEYDAIMQARRNGHRGYVAEKVK